MTCSKRNGGMPDECRGRYDPAIYTTLDNICEDCYNLYKEPDIHSMCRYVIGLSVNHENVVTLCCIIVGRIASVAPVSSIVSRRCYWSRTDLLTWLRLSARGDAGL